MWLGCHQWFSKSCFHGWQDHKSDQSKLEWVRWGFGMGDNRPNFTKIYEQEKKTLGSRWRKESHCHCPSYWIAERMGHALERAMENSTRPGFPVRGVRWTVGCVGRGEARPSQTEHPCSWPWGGTQPWILNFLLKEVVGFFFFSPNLVGCLLFLLFKKHGEFQGLG